MDIRKFIKEEIEKTLNKKELEKKFDQDISYLSGFSLLKKENKGTSTVWVFEHKEKNYILRFYIQHNKKDGAWKTKIFIYWKTESGDLTAGRGKDVESSFGPYYSYLEMIKDLNTKLKNNPLISPSNYFDDNNSQLLKDTMQLIKVLKGKKADLDSVDDKHFKDLKKISQEINNLNTDEELEEYAKNKSGDVLEQGFWLTLNKIFQINFFKQKEQLDDLF